MALPEMTLRGGDVSLLYPDQTRNHTPIEIDKDLAVTLYPWKGDTSGSQ